MDLKVFAMGAFCGAAVFAIVTSYIDSGEPEAADAAPADDPPAAAEPVASPPDNSAVEANESAGDGGETLSEPGAQVVDDSWAYKMEQTLQQYFAGHDHAAKFEIITLRCQPAVCEVQAVAANEAAVPAWQQILYDMRQQAWHEFRQTGGWSSTRNGGLKTLVTLHRVGPGDESAIDDAN